MTTEQRFPTPPPSREHLLRYLRGELSPEEQHAVERRIEEDPLVREAVEGLTQPGAIAAAESLGSPFAPRSAQWPYRVLGGALVLGVVGVVVYLLRMEDPKPEEVRTLLTGTSEQPVAPQHPNTDSVLRVVHDEIAQAAVRPATPPAPAPAPPERFLRLDTAVLPVHRDTTTRPITTSPVTPPQNKVERDPMPVHAPRSSRQLIFLHDLKLVHPQELYGSHPPQLVPEGIPADRENANAPSGPEPMNVSYLDFMDRAMGAFAMQRTAVALDDLYFLLGQYPDDVNAQFYAGLCCYQLGLYPRAERLLDQAAHNTVDTFNEEAAWYLALAVEQQRGRNAAQEAFARIADQGGFYAGQARTKLAP